MFDNTPFSLQYMNASSYEYQEAALRATEEVSPTIKYKISDVYRMTVFWIVPPFYAMLNITTESHC